SFSRDWSSDVCSSDLLLRRLYRETKSTELSPDLIHLFLQESGMEEMINPSTTPNISLRTRKGNIRPRGANQQRYVQSILDNDIKDPKSVVQGKSVEIG